MMLNSQRLLTAFAICAAIGYGQTSLPGLQSGLAGYGFAKQHVVPYLGVDRHIYQLADTSNWSLTDLTGLAAKACCYIAEYPPDAAPLGSPLAAYFDGSYQNTDYIGSDNHIHDLRSYNYGWLSFDLTQMANAPDPATFTPLVVYLANGVHLNFIGKNNHVYEILMGSGFRSYDLTQLAGAPNAGVTPLAGYATPFNGQQHVDFIGDDGHVHELWYDGAWHHNDLTEAAEAPLARTSSGSLDGYITSNNRQQHVNFIGEDNHVHELWYDSAWHHNDLTQATGAPPALPWSSLDGYETAFNSQQHVDFIDSNYHLHELYYSGGWHHSDLTQLLGGVPPWYEGTPLAGYVTSFDNRQHINFIDNDYHVQELWYDTAWHQTDLSAAAGVP